MSVVVKSLAYCESRSSSWFRSARHTFEQARFVSDYSTGPD